MKRTIILIATCCFALMAKGQQEDYQKPDFATIGKNIKDKNSPFYYPVQFKKYMEDDTTLTVEEYRYLYYGFSFQPEYDPYGKSAVLDKLRTALDKKDMTPPEIDQVITMEKTVLKEFPFNLRNLNMLVNMYDKKNGKVNAEKAFKKLLGVARAIMSTGTGLADSAAMYVISVEHEYDMLGLLEYEFGGSQHLVSYKGSQMDYLTVADNKYLTKGMYFNVDRLFASMEKMFKKD